MDTMDKTKQYAWFSQEMFNLNKKCYIYTTTNNNLIRATAISTSDTEPFNNTNSSILNDFKCLGQVSSYVRAEDTSDTLDTSIIFQKKIMFPKPLPY